MTVPDPVTGHDVIVFEHIPKTAGSTLRHVLWHQFGTDHVVHTNMRNPAARTEQLMRRILSGRPPRAISSHLGYGLHERLPGGLRYAHVTMLRNPIDRTISHYYYALERGKIGEGTSLVEFCQLDALNTHPPRAWNQQASYLGGLRVRQICDGLPFCPEDFDDELLERAKANLDTFAAVGLVSRFEESLLLLGRTFGWPLHTLRSVPKNVGKRRPKRVALSDEERAALEAANQLDLALYRHAERRFEALLTERVPDLDERLRSLSRLNRVYRSVAPAVERLGTLRRYARRAVRASRG